MSHQFMSLAQYIGASAKALLSKLNPFAAPPLSAVPQFAGAGDLVAMGNPSDAAAMNSAIALEILRDRRADQASLRRWTQTKRLLFTVFVLATCGIPIFIVLKTTNVLPNFNWSAGDYTVGTVTIAGEIGKGPGSAEAIIPALRAAFDDKKVQRVIVRVNSGGGVPSEAERIYREIDRLHTKTNKPVETVIDTLGASAAYMIAIHTDRITASSYSLVGSIGAIMQMLNAAELAQKLGVGYQTYKSGALKDLGNLTRRPTAMDIQHGQALVERNAQVFADEVVKLRGPRLQIRRPELTTGEVWAGVDALTHGLIDALGTFEMALGDAKAKNFGPHPSNPLSGLFSETAEQIGSAFAGGVVARLKAESGTATTTLR